MFSTLRKFSVVGSVIAFARSPMGQQLIEKAKVAAADPANRAKAAEMVGRLRRQPQRTRVVDESEG